MSRREGVVLSVLVHVLALVAFLFLPKLPYFQRLEAERQARLAKELDLAQQEKDQARFVYVVPKVEMQAKKPPQRAELSDLDRNAQSLRPPPNPKNPLPFSLGNTTDRVEAQKQAKEKPRGQGPAPQPSQAQQPQTQTADATSGQQQPQANTAPLPFNTNGAVANPSNKPTQDPNRGQQAAAPGGSLGQALRNIEKYTDANTFNNPEGNVGQVGPSIQFDTKGVDFGPWIRRFIAQVKRNWFIPMAAMSLKGHVVLQFRIHKSGAITDLVVVQPSTIEAFTNAAVNAIRGSNPTQPLPPEYPDENALFTVTFYYNETPP
jgi:TonB family protein